MTKADRFKDYSIVVSPDFIDADVTSTHPFGQMHEGGQLSTDTSFIFQADLLVKSPCKSNKLLSHTRLML